jgi:hypothetical protein
VPIQIHVESNIARGTEAFKRARRTINDHVKRALLEVGERVVLPTARAKAAKYKVEGQAIADTLMIRTTARSGYIASRLRGRRNRAIGLLEYGGVVTTTIRPRHDSQSDRPAAVLTPWGPKALVSGERRYTGRFFLTHAVEEKADDIAQGMLPELLKAFEPLEHQP